MKKFDIDALYLVQFNLGFLEVDYRTGRVLEEKQKGKEEFKKYKKDNPGEVVIGPGGKVYLVNGNHFAVALKRNDSSKMWAMVVADFSNLEEEQFWTEMNRPGNKFCHLKDRGKVRPASELPKKSDEMTDDPYRSLAWLLEKTGAYVDANRRFAEFEWADFLRESIPDWPNDDKGWKEAMAQGAVLAKSKKTQHLPGWIGKEGKCEWLLNRIAFLEKALKF